MLIPNGKNPMNPSIGEIILIVVKAFFENKSQTTKENCRRRKEFDSAINEIESIVGKERADTARKYGEKNLY